MDLKVMKKNQHQQQNQINKNAMWKERVKTKTTIKFLLKFNFHTISLESAVAILVESVKNSPKLEDSPRKKKNTPTNSPLTNKKEIIKERDNNNNNTNGDNKEENEKASKKEQQNKFGNWATKWTTKRTTKWT